MLDSTISWLAFCVSSQLTKTVLHIFPSAGVIGAPYQTACSLTLLQTDTEPQTIVAEGAKLFQPDGFRFDAAFPEIVSAEPQALLLELSTTQPRVNLSYSDCIIEFNAQSFSVRYAPHHLVEDVDTFLPLIVLQENGLEASLLTVNAMDAVVRFSIQRMVDQGEASIDKFWELSSLEVPAHGILEYPLNDLKTSLGTDAAMGLYVKSGYSSLAHYVVYRQAKTQKIIAVSGLCGG